MPTRPLSALAQDYPGTDPAKFAAPNGIDPQHVSLVGFVIDGVHYSGGCTTRRGAYPYCESLVVPSYSPAKRSEERRLGKECVRTCRSRWSLCQSKKNTNKSKLA